jgi:hypothetical protein
VQIITEHLLCPVKDFPIPYLGVPLSIWKLRAQDLQPLIDNLHDKLSGWRAGLLSKGDRLVLVKSVLSTTPIHIMLATDIPKPITEAIVKCQRSFFWKMGATTAVAAVPWHGMTCAARLSLVGSGSSRYQAYVLGSPGQMAMAKSL